VINKTKTEVPISKGAYALLRRTIANHSSLRFTLLLDDLLGLGLPAEWNSDVDLDVVIVREFVIYTS
jgi:hypothetical protein